jgi:hypothetical protein
VSARILPRELGCRLTCNGCGATSVTASISITGNRAYAASLGWGRGSDPGRPYREGREAQPTVRDEAGKLIKRAVPALPGIPGRPRNTKHDLCPTCLAKDRAATEARKAKRTKQVAARDAGRKARDQKFKPVAA